LSTANKAHLRFPKKLHPLLEKRKRFKVIIGGRGSAKSVTVAKLLAAKVHQESCKVLAAREMMNSLADSVHSTFLSQISKYKMDGFNVLANEIRHSRGGAIIYRGLARNPEGLKSMDNIAYCWIEEAQTISEKSLELLTPSIRAKESEIWMTANPRSANDPFSKRFIKPFEKELSANGCYEDDLHLIIVCNYTDNKWFPPELEQERLYDYEHKERALYDHIWLGKFDDTVSSAIIKPEWFDACIDAHKKLGFKPIGIEVVAHDPSDTGNDNKGLAYRHGSVLVDCLEMDTGDINAGGDWAVDYALQHNTDVFTYDGDGMGVGLKRQFSEAFAGKRVELQMYRGSNSPENPDDFYDAGPEKQQKTHAETFRNKRAQAYWLLRDRIHRTYQAVTKKVYCDPGKMISISSDIEHIDMLRSELCRIPLKNNGMGMIQIMTKQEMKRLGIESPNMADSIAMAFSVGIKPAHAKARAVVIESASGWT